MSKLVFKIGEETVPTVMGNDEFYTTPFVDQLQSCKRLLLEMLQTWHDTSEGIRDNRIKNQQVINNKPVVNNIIAFLGERGSGKSSCLYSMRKIFSESEQEMVYSKDTEFLDIIDPSFFDEHHNILELFIGELYHCYENIVSDWEKLPNSERQNIRNLQGWFSKIRQSIKFLNVQKLELPEEEEGLSALSEGVNLSMLIGELVKAYLKCKHKKYLVISIDDIDLNIREAYSMMEKIRKYLVVPNVVILMAGKLEQLKNSIILNLTEYYKSILTSVIDIHDIQMMADRYLDKFIPLERRILMPTLADYSTAELDIINKDEDVATPENHFDSVEFAVLSLIYKKCGYLLYNYEDTPSLIIPDNLRELRSLVTTLYEMGERVNDPQTHEKNKSVFKEYFYNQWMHRLGGNQQEIAKTILREDDITKINKTVVALLHEHAKSLRLYSEENHQNNSENGNLNKIRIKEIVNPANYSENISVGDVMMILNDLKNVAASSRINNLVFFIRTFYSMKLYELYDVMTEKVDCDNVMLADNNPLSKLLPKLKSSKEYRIPDFFKIVGNSFFTLTGESFLPALNNRDISREISLMNGVLLFDLIDDIIKKYEENNEIINTQDFITKLNIVEFFIACTSRRIELKDGRYSYFEESSWRAEISDFYFYPLHSRNKNLLFDITAPFVNLILPKLAYRRFSKKLFPIAYKCPESILRKLYDNNRRYKSKNIHHDLISRMAIRNTEVLNDITRWLEDSKDKYLDDKNKDLLILRDFYGNFNGDYEESNGVYFVYTYELNKDIGDFHTIEFTPFSVLADFLNTLYSKTDNENFEKIRKENIRLFYRIYRKENMLTVDTIYNLQELIAILRDSRESDIPNKDDIITSVMRNNERIKSNLLVEYLAAFDIVSKVLFSKYFDDELFNKYRTLAIKNIDQHQDSLDREIQILEHRKSSFEEDYEGVSREINKIMRSISSISRRLSRNESVLDTSNQKLQEIKKDIHTLSYDIAEREKKIDSMRKELEELAKSYQECEQDKLNTNSEIDKIEGLKDESQGSDYNKSLKYRIAHLKNHLDEIEKKSFGIKTHIDTSTKDLVNLQDRVSVIKETRDKRTIEQDNLLQTIDKYKDDIEKDKPLQESLLINRHTLEQRQYEIKETLDSINKNLGILRKERESSRIKRENIINTLNKSGR